MLGNDVVDLLDVDARPETFHRRFDARVFTLEERERIARDADGALSPTRPEHPHGAAPQGPRPHLHALRWAHWAAKEAAYKLLRQLDSHFVFSPTRLVARFDAPGTGRLPGSTRAGRLEVVGGVASPVAIELTSFETSDSVHVVALREGGDWQSVVNAVEQLPDRPAERIDPSGPASEALSASVAVRRLALREIARALDVAPSRIAIGRRGRIPTLELDGRKASVALSLSHHGRFIAFAMMPRGRGLRLVSGVGAVAEAGADEGGARRDETGDGQVAQRVGVVGAPDRRADTERMAG